VCAWRGCAPSEVNLGCAGRAFSGFECVESGIAEPIPKTLALGAGLRGFHNQQPAAGPQYATGFDQRDLRARRDT
jgi:hypothetical protein